MKPVLVTGGGGFLGRYIIKELLNQGRKVRMLCRSAHPDLVESGVELCQGDIRDAAMVEKACRDVETVFHTAALAGIWGDPDEYYSTNVEGTRNVIRACQTKHVETLVYTSSPSVTFSGGNQQMVNESEPYPERFLCSYPETKAQAEKEVLLANSPDLKTVSLRPHLIWGVGDNHLIPTLIKRARQGRLRIVGNRCNRVDMVHVVNAAHAHVLAEKALKEEKCNGKAYFITNDEPVNLWLWINELLKKLDIDPVEKRVSEKIAYTAGHLLEKLHFILGLKGEPRMTRFLARQLATHHTYNINAAKCDLGYEIRVSMQEGLDELVRYYQSRDAKVSTSGVLVQS